MISISIVSHGQMPLVRDLLADIQRTCGSKSIEVILTLNLPADQVGDLSVYTFPIKVIRNAMPLGFGANHNQAFRAAKGNYFCVLNPDIRLQQEPFDALVRCLTDDSIGVAAPLVLNGDGQIDDSARKFPSPLAILCKALGFKRQPSYVFAQNNIYPDWVAGMFMVFCSDTYRLIDGFDERYFLYYEDVDICARLTNIGKRVIVCPNSKVTHWAQRASHRNLKYMRWHVTSMLLFFMSAAYWRVLWR